MDLRVLITDIWNPLYIIILEYRLNPCRKVFPLINSKQQTYPFKFQAIKLSPPFNKGSKNHGSGQCYSHKFHHCMCASTRNLIILFKWSEASSPLDIRRKLNLHKTFRRRLGRIRNVLCTINLRLKSRGLGCNSKLIYHNFLGLQTF